MAGMTEVGRLFNNNELIVAEVLQSAEAMKAVVDHLEQFMEKADTAARGKIVLATVKGDVHDIGKNLVEIILANNGYQVINLGIKVPPDDLIEAWREHQPDAIGLSGLLVKSAHQMVTTASDFKDQGVAVPLLVGGAALSEKFATTRIGPAYGAPTFYAKDAMTGLRIMNELMDPAQREVAIAAHLFTTAGSTVAESAPIVNQHRAQPQGAHRYSDSCRCRISTAASATCPTSPRSGATSTRSCCTAVISGSKAISRNLLVERDPKALELYRRRRTGEVEAAAVHEGPRRVAVLRSRARWQLDPFVRARRGQPVARLPISHASPKADRLCLSDYVLIRRARIRRVRRAITSRLFVVTAGEGIREHSEEAKAARRVLPRPRPAGPGARNRGSLRRVAPSPHARGLGLSAIRPHSPCRNASRRSIAASATASATRRVRISKISRDCSKLLRPEEIGVQLTEGFMMDPEASVSALVFHHPDCAYFTASEVKSDVKSEVLAEQ